MQARPGGQRRYHRGDAVSTTPTSPTIDAPAPFAGATVTVVVAGVAADVVPRVAWVLESLLAPYGATVAVVDAGAPAGTPHTDSSGGPLPVVDGASAATIGYGTAGSRLTLAHDPAAWAPTRTPPTGDDLATAFWWLARVEEQLATAADLDDHDRFRFGASALAPLVARDGSAAAPVDAIAERFGAALGLALAPWPGGRRLALALSHDVDLPVRWNRQGALQCARGVRDDLRAGRAWRALRETGLLAMAAWWRRSGSDPYLNMAAVNHLEERHGAQAGACSTHFVIAASHDPHDPDAATYDAVRDEVVRQALDGGEVGLHTSYTGSVVDARLEHELAALTRVAGRPVTAHRFHYLRHQPPRDWPRLATAGLAADSSLGHATHPGLRSGFSHPYRAWHHAANRPLDLVLVPMAIMDCTFEPRYLDVEPRHAWHEHVLPILEHAHAHGSGISVLFHNDKLAPRHATQWLRLYERILRWGRDNDALMAGVGAVAAAWRSRITPGG